MAPSSRARSSPLRVLIIPQARLHPSRAQSLWLTEASETRNRLPATWRAGVVRSRLPAADLLGMQGRWCPVGVTVASGLRPGNPSPGGTAGAESPQLGVGAGGGCLLEGNHWPAWIPREPQSIPAGTLTIQNPPAALLGIWQPWNQKSVERLEPGLARRRATQSVFHDKGRGWVDNPRQRSPLVQSPSYFCATPEEGDEKQASDLRELAPRPASHGVGIETRPRGRTGEITCLC